MVGFFLLLLSYVLVPSWLYSSDQNNRRNLIVFIHGYTGDPYKTWTSTDGIANWVDLFNEDRDLKELGFYSEAYRFESSEKARNAPRINVLSRDLLEYLREKSSIEKNIEQIYIIAHSLGGLISLDAVSNAYQKIDDREYSSVFYKVKAIFLIASPLEGVPVGNVVKYVCRNKQILDVDSDRPYNEILNSKWTEIYKKFEGDRRPNIYTCYEAEDTEIRKFVLIRRNVRLVPASSLSPNRDEDPFEMVGKDHIRIVKPLDPNDRVYKWVKDRLMSTAFKIKSNDLKSLDGLDRYLNGIELDHIRKYLAREDLKELEIFLRIFSKQYREKDYLGLRDTVHRILKIIPTEPFFRLHKTLLDGGLMGPVFQGHLRIVQVIRWDWTVKGDEKAEVFVITRDDDGNRVTYGPFTNNIISMLDKPVQKSIQLRFQSTGIGKFSMYPQTFRIGWSVAEKEDNIWQPLIGPSELVSLAEYVGKD